MITELYRQAFFVVTLFSLIASSARAAVINVPADHATIQAAINAAVDTDEIIVAPGTYVEVIDFLGKAIALRSSGGAVVTIIDGDGAFHVVKCITGEGSDTILDGFTITGGNANGTFPDSAGGGMWNDSASPTVTNCTFSENVAEFGGGMFNGNGSNPSVTDCTFSDNEVSRGGGGMLNSSSSPQVHNSAFYGNQAAGDGGGLFNGAESNPTVAGCHFSGNSAFSGGAMFTHRSNPTVTNCAFIANTAISGAGMWNWGSGTTVTNCTFTGNDAFGDGGGIFVIGGSVSVTNCILWGNTWDEVVSGTIAPTIAFSDIEGSGGSGSGWDASLGTDGGGNIDADPLFLNPVVGDLHLQAGSPAIGTGDNTAIPVGVTTDLDGSPRIIGDDVDMGAYEMGCGDGVQDSGEQCDDGGESPTCDVNCTTALCGDGLLNASAGEVCDDGDVNDNNDCTNMCRGASCGDGVVWNQGTGVEQCDGGPGCTNCCLDQDEDATCDDDDDCPTDPGKTKPGVCGCGVSDEDMDGDRKADCTDRCPNDPDKLDPGVCGCGVPDEGDIDGDTVLDCVDRCPDEDDTIDVDRNGIRDCQQYQSVPTVSEWGIVSLILLLVAGLTIKFRDPVARILARKTVSHTRTHA